jgi:hypothetical protein
MPRRDRGNQETNVAKMTKQQALDKLDKAVGKVADEGMRRIEANLPKLKASAKKLAEQLKADESPELIDTQSKHLKLQMRAVGEGTLLLDEAIRRLKEFEKDDELFELVADEMTEAMGYATKPLEAARKELANAKKLLDLATKAGEQHASDTKQARKEWAEAVAEVDGLCAGSQKEIKAWDEWDKATATALAQHDKKELLRLQKAKPASAALDEVGKQPPGMAFKAFDKEFKRDTLAEDLRKEIDSDRNASIIPWFNAQTAAKKKVAIEARVAALKIEPRDAGKALVPLGLPAAAKAKLQAALDGPDAMLVKTIEAIAKGCGVRLPAADVLPKLKKAGVI